MKNDLPPACIFQISLTINSESTWPRLILNPFNLDLWSTIQQLLIFLHDIFCSKYQTDTIYLDISKAFDSASHFHLLDKFTSFNISGRLWLWFRAYLTNRFQYVSVNNKFSQLLPVESEVPQGSILGPLLFIIYMNDISDAVLYCKTLLFADDTKCFCLIKSYSNQQLLQQDLNSLFN